MRSRENKSAGTRRAIADAAVRLFVERGFDYVTVSEIAEAAEVSRSTVFRHFAVKEALVFDEPPEDRLVTAVREKPAVQSMSAAIEQIRLAGRTALVHEPPQRTGSWASRRINRVSAGRCPGSM